MANWKPAGAVCAFTLVAATLAFPKVAEAGFFEQLFGGPQPEYRPEPDYDAGGFFESRRPLPREHHNRRAAEDTPVRQTPTDIMHDKTLRPGDAYMTASGLKIFIGKTGEVHDVNDFVPLSQVRFLNKRERMQFAALEPASPALRTDAAVHPGTHPPAPGRARNVISMAREQAALPAEIRYAAP